MRFVGVVADVIFEIWTPEFAEQFDESLIVHAPLVGGSDVV